MKLSFSLTNKAKPVGAAPSLKRPAALSSFEEDEPVDAAPTASDNRDTAVNKKLLAQNVGSSKATKKRMDNEMKVDATVYEYDEVWDKMQEAKQKQKEAKEVDAKARKPKYIHGLLNSAATRRLDYLRAEEKMIQREREAEGDEFNDKEAFVTQAYKDQMAEVRRAEEEEKKRDELERKKKGDSSTGMAHFYRKLLEETEQKHEETVAATSSQSKPVKGPQGPTPNLTITKPPNFTTKSDLELARLAREQGKDVELNDDNQIVDKRDLLSAGLNLSAPNTRRLGLQKATGTAKDGQTEEVQAHRAVGTAASRREINERRARDIRRQVEEEEERMAKQRELENQEAIQRVVMKRNTRDDIMSAHERYLERKRRKLEEAAAANVPPEHFTPEVAQ
ncbi:hypothetical protein SERLA73DRAFT_185382 [Serpula lacrymans var. lacrymans S7.3]|uniref:Nuclear speckle splicing regulatory protein 1 N-terminal domain-containing protein n=2 Tax=Serpula lacrymans var. lacrymans TaxID=341189 RepID=F8Q5Q5_SERL3|nr:uncharacterized protein SERLADRAFT_473841 [Serpula lacrymans var. lacrymans S7.9]EGN95943.1 hypothetical protein SERLA73DRAFT_185382 [Serpula lacrymans var. lacrymans S7.3]EGO21465.1 hypothetical protein SERLADRAFT_473841 [Serpula lacrymans var. lacrymans S7.9]